MDDFQCDRTETFLRPVAVGYAVAGAHSGEYTQVSSILRFREGRGIQNTQSLVSRRSKLRIFILGTVIEILRELERSIRKETPEYKVQIDEKSFKIVCDAIYSWVAAKGYTLEEFSRYSKVHPNRLLQIIVQTLMDLGSPLFMNLESKRQDILNAFADSEFRAIDTCFLHALKVRATTGRNDLEIDYALHQNFKRYSNFLDLENELDGILEDRSLEGM